MSTRIPPLLEPYIHIPQSGSLILLTSVLGASTNWLVLRFLYNALSSVSRDPHAAEAEAETAAAAVVLVSFMRDFEFWKDGARRLGLDLQQLTRAGQFTFIDGLTTLFAVDGTESLSSQRTHAAATPQAVLDDPTAAGVGATILRQVKVARNGRVLLVLDQPDLLLAATEDDIGAVGMMAMIMGLREYVHSTVVTLAADSPLTQSPTTPLEIQHSAFLVTLAHQASYVMSLRLLDTGTAKDVSGVMRVTMGPEGVDGGGRDGEEEGGDVGVEERELLYYVGGDGGVKVFERGQ
ncbi:MAG: hypothetical protein M1835_002406 [Candelina submexicana]|nr:MAG: hypothetical protein M1835_002406 [Candelina submexicana]